MQGSFFGGSTGFVSQKLFDHITYWGDQVKEVELGQVCVKYGEDWKYKQGFDGGEGGAEGKRPLGRPRHIWENNFKTDLEE
jgi:hypothetical protein